jgi:hypothetical protein
MHDSTQNRIRGWILLLIGAGVSIAMAYLMVLIGGIMAHSNEPGATTRYSGTAWQAFGIFGVLGLVLLFGVCAGIAGAFQILYGERNWIWIRRAVLIAGVLWLIGLAIRVFTRFYSK